VRLGLLATGVVGSGRTLIHVDRFAILPARKIRRLVLRPAEYARLIRFVSVQLLAEDGALPQPLPGYGFDDRFFESRRDFAYSALFNCNNWIGEGLKQAGVRVGRWTPFSASLLWSFDDQGAQ
jgi:hypothetical protein